MKDRNNIWSVSLHGQLKKMHSIISILNKLQSFSICCFQLKHPGRIWPESSGVTSGLMDGCPSSSSFREIHKQKIMRQIWSSFNDNTAQERSLCIIESLSIEREFVYRWIFFIQPVWKVLQKKNSFYLYRVDWADKICCYDRSKLCLLH